MDYNHDTYISPFTWRYASCEMKEIFSEVHKRKLLRRVWIALAKAESKAGIVSKDQIDDLIAHKDDIDIERASEIEEMIKHDLMAEIKTYAEQCKIGGKIIHLGATSMDVLDNMDVLRHKEALSIIKDKVVILLNELVSKMEEYKSLACMAFTHIQPAEITTVGYRISQTAQDLLDDYLELNYVYSSLRGKGMKGAVGTAASYAELLKGTNLSAEDLENSVMEELGLTAYDAATQIYSRKQDLRIAALLSNISATIYKFAQDFRILQSPPIGEWSEPFGKYQVGSSAMPFKRNPINSEKIDSLCRLIESNYSVAWQNAATTVLERSLDDSANRRIFIPESFLALDEILLTAIKIVKGMNIHISSIERTMKAYGIFAATERLLMEAGKRGADRQEMHEIIREYSLKAWAEVQSGKDNELKEMLKRDENVLKYLTADEADDLLDATCYTGDATKRCEKVISRIKTSIK